MRYTSGMDTKSTSLRIDQVTRDRLRCLSEKSGVSITKLVTLATAYYVEQVEKSGTINVPLNQVRNINVVAHQSVVNGGVINNHVPAAASGKRAGRTKPKKTSERQSGKP